MPYNAEQLTKEHGASYEKKFIPCTPNVVKDGNLITGQNLFSASVTAEAIIDNLQLK